MKSDHPYILTIECPDTRGVVATVAGYLCDNYANIVESSEFNDSVGNLFFMRVKFTPDGPMPDIDELNRGFSPIAARSGL